MKRMALVALPWAVADRPSGALASLAPHARQKCPDWQIDCYYLYLEVAMEVGIPLYQQLTERAMDLGEILYAGLFYPERREAVSARLASALGEMGLQLADEMHFPQATYGADRTYASIAEQVLAILERHLLASVERLSSYDVVGFTTSFGQLYGNLFVSARLKERQPLVQTLLGGSSISSAVGPSILREYLCVDYIVQGEGELPLVALLRKLGAGERGGTEPRGVLSRANLEQSPTGVASWEVTNMDELPLPDYGGYAELVEKIDILWTVPIEGSRGCWWDRGKRTGNPRNTCYFCNLNVQWDGYRQKSVDRLVREIDELSTRYANPLLFFLDNIIRTKGVEELSERVKAHNKDYLLFYEMRAHMSPYEILCLWEMGLRWGQFGIEALSTPYLKRIGKGTSTIQNLQAMKTCYELNINNMANLIVDFPGSTEEEVLQTRDAILQYAIMYHPLRVVSFEIGIGSTVEQLRDAFGVTNVRNADFWKVGLPDEVYERLLLFNRSGDFPHADWSPVRDAVETWGQVYQAARASPYQHVVTYADGGTFLKIVDARSGIPQLRVLQGWEREVYLACMEIIRYTDLVERLTDGSAASIARLDGLLDELTGKLLMYREDGKCLSLAPAVFPDLAARRIRNAHARGRGTSRPAEAQAARSLAG
jgi:ribosomal peptide maturation radical SAM protein 1